MLSLWNLKTALWPEPWKSDYEERAAIREFDGGYDRDEAERMAFAEIAKRKRRHGEQASSCGGGEQ